MDIDALRRMIEGGRDGAMPRLTLGEAMAREGQTEEAVGHFEKAIAFDPDYSAAWRALGRLQLKSGDTAAATQTFRQGLAAARRRGDMQIVRELEVRLKRLQGE
jgi:Tfp pilus assembly protein PilF